MKTIRQIAEELGVSKQAIQRRLSQLPTSTVTTSEQGIKLINAEGEAILKAAMQTKLSATLPTTEPLTQQQLDKQAERFCVYKHTVPNGKVYIGITTMKPSKRWSGGDGYKANEDFYKDIVEFGWDSIDHRIMASGLVKNEAETEEDRLILEYKSYLPESGYNKQFRLLPLTVDDGRSELNALIAMLQRELDIKNEQIRELTATVKELGESINHDRKNELAGTLIDGQKRLMDGGAEIGGRFARFGTKIDNLFSKNKGGERDE